MKNQMDTRNRAADEIFAELRALRSKVGGPCVLAVLGSHTVDAQQLADVLRTQWSTLVGNVGFEPKRLMTGCVDVGVEKAVRLAAKSITGKLAVIVHRAELTYGVKPAERMRDTLLAQEADALLLFGGGCKHARERFWGHGKKVIEIDID
jgi:hypothetical protein